MTGWSGCCCGATSGTPSSRDWEGLRAKQTCRRQCRLESLQDLAGVLIRLTLEDYVYGGGKGGSEGSESGGPYVWTDTDWFLHWCKAVLAIFREEELDEPPGSGSSEDKAPRTSSSSCWKRIPSWPTAKRVARRARNLSLEGDVYAHASEIEKHRRSLCRTRGVSPPGLSTLCKMAAKSRQRRRQSAAGAAAANQTAAATTAAGGPPKESLMQFLARKAVNWNEEEWGWEGGNPVMEDLDEVDGGVLSRPARPPPAVPPEATATAANLPSAQTDVGGLPQTEELLPTVGGAGGG